MSKHKKKWWKENPRPSFKYPMDCIQKLTQSAYDLERQIEKEYGLPTGSVKVDYTSLLNRKKKGSDG